MRVSFLLGCAAAALLVTATPLRGQDAQGEATTWQLGGLRAGFCVQLLLDPNSELLRELPSGVHPVPASAAAGLHLSLRSVIEGQTEFGAWSPARICFTTVDTIRTKDFSLTDRSGRHPQLFVLWTVLAAGPSGTPEDVALDLFANSDRLIRSARLAGQELHEAKVMVGKVPAEDENGVASTDDRFQVKLGGTTITWDGRLAGDSVAVPEPVQTRWVTASARGAVGTSTLALTPATRAPWSAHSGWTGTTRSRRRLARHPRGSQGRPTGAGTGR